MNTYFELWLLEQFPLFDLTRLKRDDIGYLDDLISAMFISFCAGWEFKKLKDENSIR